MPVSALILCHMPMILCCVFVRVGNMLFSVETQTTDERTQQYQSEIEALYKDLTAKGKTLMLSTELGVRTSVFVSVSLCTPLNINFTSSSISC